jgi:hypothetical protein
MIGEARADLVTVLAPILPGRVYPYAPSAPSPVAPAVYVSTFDADWATDVSYAVTFAVRLVADGASDAAHALLDDLCDQARAAVAGSDNCYPGALRWEPLDIDAAQSLPAYTFNVAVDVATRQWCAADAATAITIPPVPIGVPL